METNDAVDTSKRVIKEVVRFVYYYLRVVATSSVMEFYGFSVTEWDIGNMFKLAFFTLVGDEIWKLTKANASRLNSKDDVSTLTSKDDAAAIRNPSTAAEDAVLASLISLDSILKQLKDIMRQTPTNVVSGAKNKSLLASLDELREQISSVLDIDNLVVRVILLKVDVLHRQLPKRKTTLV